MLLIRIVGLVMLLVSSSVLAGTMTIDINSADATVLAEHIKGIGEKKAREIVRYRNENGPFLNIEELTNVTGIGEKTVEINRSRLTVNQ